MADDDFYKIEFARNEKLDKFLKELNLKEGNLTNFLLLVRLLKILRRLSYQEYQHFYLYNLYMFYFIQCSFWGTEYERNLRNYSKRS